MTNVDAGVRERERVAALHRYDVLDTPAEEAFDRITRIAHNLLHMAIVTVTFIDSHRQWFKSRQGLASTETLRDTAFFGEVIRQDETFLLASTRYGIAASRMAQSILSLPTPLNSSWTEIVAPKRILAFRRRQSHR